MFRDDAAMAASLDDGLDLACWIGERSGADVISVALLWRQGRQLGQEFQVVEVVVALLSGVASRMDARSVTQSRSLAHSLGATGSAFARSALPRSGFVL